MLQSLPFVLVGAFASALVRRYVSGSVVARWMPRRPLPAVLVSCLFGFVAPVCDCGVVPLARRLSAKGVPLHATVAFVVAAPVANPVVLLATAVAFQGDWRVVALRAAMTLSVAIAVGLSTSALFAPAGSRARSPLPIGGGAPDLAEPTPRARPVPALVAHATNEYFDVIFFIVLGALFTAATQALIPRGDLTAVGSHPIGSVATLMPIATLLSICSEADAFVARAFATSFSLGAVLAFMTIGQIVDLRNGLLLFRTLGAELFLLIVGVSYGLVFLEAIAINRLTPGL
ncbi:MAG TPA: permease [Chloroflexota bacterium]|nr:permease [Chloroflexota bacterium]